MGLQTSRQWLALPVSIIIGAVVLAAAILVSNQYQIVNSTEAFTVFRLNRWAGVIEICFIDAETVSGDKGLAGAKLACKDK